MIEWNEECEQAFTTIKEYLMNPPILIAPTPGKPLFLYLTILPESMGSMLGQNDKKETSIQSTILERSSLKEIRNIQRLKQPVVH